jgi:hypothetical protein
MMQCDEIKSLSALETVRNAMEQHVMAERERPAAEARAEGDKAGRMNRSEGHKMELNDRSEREKHRRINEAEGRARRDHAPFADATAASLERIAQAAIEEGGVEAVRIQVVEQSLKARSRIWRRRRRRSSSPSVSTISWSPAHWQRTQADLERRAGLAQAHISFALPDGPSGEVDGRGVAASSSRRTLVPNAHLSRIVREDAMVRRERGSMSTNTRNPDRPMTHDEAAEIIREATKISLDEASKPMLDRSDLATMAKELGITESALDRAIASKGAREEQRNRAQHHLDRFRRHAGSYVTTIAMLGAIDFFTGPGWWVHNVAMWWGLGLATHGITSLSRYARDRGR